MGVQEEPTTNPGAPGLTECGWKLATPSRSFAQIRGPFLLPTVDYLSFFIILPSIILPQHPKQPCCERLRPASNEKIPEKREVDDQRQWAPPVQRPGTVKKAEKQGVVDQRIRRAPALRDGQQEEKMRKNGKVLIKRSGGSKRSRPRITRITRNSTRQG